MATPIRQDPEPRRLRPVARLHPPQNHHTHRRPQPAPEHDPERQRQETHRRTKRRAIRTHQDGAHHPQPRLGHTRRPLLGTRTRHIRRRTRDTPKTNRKNLEKL